MLLAILEMSRVGRRDGGVTEVDLSELLDRSLAAEPLPEGFALEREGDLPRLKTSALRLEQMLRHLIDNACQHHDADEGRIVVAVAEAAPGWRIEVRDDGPSIAPKQRERAMKMFHSTVRDDPKRLGVGLPLARRIARHTGGELTLEGNEGERGLTVVVHYNPGWSTEEE